MATQGIFTVDDLYAGRAREYHHSRSLPRFTLTTETGWSEIFQSDSDVISTTQKIVHVDHLTKFENGKSVSFLESVTLQPFTYVHWLLISFAIVFILTLKAVAIYYCCRYYYKTRKVREEKKKQTVPNIYQYRSSSRSTPLFNIYQSSTPFLFSSPTHSRRAKTPDSLNNQLLRKGLEAVGTPQSIRNHEILKEQTNSFTSTASDLLTEMKDRLSTRSSKTQSVTRDTSEVQSANLELSDETKGSS